MADLERMVESVLSRDETMRINFSLENFWVHGLHFFGVLCALRNKTITVRHDPALGVNDARYSYQGDRFYFGFQELAGNVTREATVVHEAMHAAMDISRKAQRLRVSEGCAYIAGALYMYYRNQKLVENGIKPNLTGIHKEAWALAAKARAQGALSQADAKPLYDALEQCDLYKGRLQDVERFDGVREPA